MSFRNFERGNICRKSRERAGKSVEASAGFVEVSTRMIHQYESGDSEVPEAKLLKMAECYGDPLLPYNYWAMTSEIAKHYGFGPFEEDNVYAAALGAADDFNQLSQKRERFIEIMKDALVIGEEHDDFSEIDKTTADCAKKMIFLRFIATRKEKTATAMAV